MTVREQQITVDRVALADLKGTVQLSQNPHALAAAQGAGGLVGRVAVLDQGVEEHVFVCNTLCCQLGVELFDHLHPVLCGDRHPRAVHTQHDDLGIVFFNEGQDAVIAFLFV